MSYPSQPSALIQPERICLTGKSAAQAGALASDGTREQARWAVEAKAVTGRQREELASAQSAATFIRFFLISVGRHRVRGGCIYAGP